MVSSRRSPRRPPRWESRPDPPTRTNSRAGSPRSISVRDLAIRAQRLPSWAPVAAIVVASFALRAILGHGVPAPYIFRDSLIYSELGKSLADTGSFLVRDEPVAGYGVVYPALLAPWYALFDSVPTVFGLCKLTNAFVMSLVAIPAYLLAREALPRRLALVGAVMSVALPGMAYSATVMTESVFYPLFVLWLLVLARALRTPSWWRAASVLVALLPLVLTRAQALSLVAVAASAPLLFAATAARPREAIRAQGKLIGVLAGTALAVSLGQLARGGSPRGLLGAYEVVASDGGYDVGLILRTWAWHVEHLTLLTVAALPVAALVILAARWRSLDEGARLILSVTVAGVFWLSLTVAAFASSFARDAIEERNLFYVAPLLLLVLLVWLDRGAPRPAALTVGAVGLAVALPILVPFGRFVGEKARADTSPPPAALDDQRSPSRPGRSPLTVGLVAGGLGLLFLTAPRKAVGAVPVAVLAVLALLSAGSWWGPHGVKASGAGALSSRRSETPRATGSTGRFPATRRSPCSGPGRQNGCGLSRTSSSTGASVRSTTPTGRAPRRPRNNPSPSPRTAPSDSTTARRSSLGICSRTPRRNPRDGWSPATPASARPFGRSTARSGSDAARSPV